MDPVSPPRPAGDPLTELQLRVARRADELAREGVSPRSLNLHAWLVAETEVLGTIPNASGADGDAAASSDALARP